MFNNLGGRGASADGDFDFLPKPRLPKRVTFLTSLILALRAPAVPGGEAEQRENECSNHGKLMLVPDRLWGVTSHSRKP
jgi:hypothetical protein